MHFRLALVATILLVAGIAGAGQMVSVATWKGDQTAALSLTDDDGNGYPIYLKECIFWDPTTASNPSDPSTWIKKHYIVPKTILDVCDKYNVKMTFFLDTRQIDEPPTEAAPVGYHPPIASWASGLQGTWDGWAQVVSRGHEIGSHTVHHLPWEWAGHSTEPIIGEIPPGWQPNPDELTVSKQRIETEISARLGTPYTCRVLAWPWGRAIWKQTASELYVASRGTRGWGGWGTYPGGVKAFCSTPTDWTDTSSVPTIDTELSQLPVRMAQIIDTNGWYVLLNHGGVTVLENHLIALEPFRDQLWCDTYGNVAVYAQVRDALEATWTETEGGYLINLCLSRTLDPSLYAGLVTLVFDETAEELLTATWQQGTKTVIPYLGGQGTYCVDIDPFGPSIAVTVTPEPATAALMGLAGAVLMWRRQRGTKAGRATRGALQQVR
jgi:peptidoglycan/xylan/chitin deacetylase (PgdA/CDA1 family)